MSIESINGSTTSAEFAGEVVQDDASRCN